MKNLTNNEIAEIAAMDRKINEGTMSIDVKKTLALFDDKAALNEAIRKRAEEAEAQYPRAYFFSCDYCGGYHSWGNAYDYEGEPVCFSCGIRHCGIKTAVKTLADFIGSKIARC